ncbi:hypothetical protein OAF85_00860 [Planctomycetota bacterium]|nr:hypothetical protein [Planctomycetota bacterium]
MAFKPLIQPQGTINMRYSQYLAESWNSIQSRLSLLQSTRWRLKSQILDLRQFKHHLTGASLDGEARAARQQEILELEQELSTVELEIELAEKEVRRLSRPTRE